MAPTDHTPTQRAQSHFVGTLMVVPLFALLILALWVVLATVLTPLSVDPERMLVLRNLLIGFGLVLDGVAATAALLKLLFWPKTA